MHVKATKKKRNRPILTQEQPGAAPATTMSLPLGAGSEVQGLSTLAYNSSLRKDAYNARVVALHFASCVEFAAHSGGTISPREPVRRIERRRLGGHTHIRDLFDLAVPENRVALVGWLGWSGSRWVFPNVNFLCIAEGGTQTCSGDVVSCDDLLAGQGRRLVLILLLRLRRWHKSTEPPCSPLPHSNAADASAPLPVLLTLEITIKE
jgi:hypothetical protein